MKQNLYFFSIIKFKYFIKVKNSEIFQEYKFTVAEKSKQLFITEKKLLLQNDQGSNTVHDHSFALYLIAVYERHFFSEMLESIKPIRKYQTNFQNSVI